MSSRGKGEAEISDFDLSQENKTFMCVVAKI